MSGLLDPNPSTRYSGKDAFYHKFCQYKKNKSINNNNYRIMFYKQQIIYKQLTAYSNCIENQNGYPIPKKMAIIKRNW